MIPGNQPRAVNRILISKVMLMPCWRATAKGGNKIDNTIINKLIDVI